MRLIDADVLMKNYGLENATKYGNEDAEQQAHSYSTLMLYEIAIMIEDAPTVDAQEIITELQMEKHDLTMELKSLEMIIADLEEKCDDREYGEWLKTFRYTRRSIGKDCPEPVYHYECSICGYNTGNQGREFSYCPRCGSDMRGSSDGTR